MKKLVSMRKQLDRVDRNIVSLLAKRMELARKVGRLKARHGIPIRQPEREKALLAHRVALGKKKGLNDKLVADMYMKILAESRRQQKNAKGRE